MTPSDARRLVQLEDVKEILDVALQTSGGEVQLPSYGAAIKWRQRAYQFRKLYAECVQSPSPYDRLTIKALAKGDTTVTLRMIEQRATFKPKATFRGASPIVEDDPLLEAARKLAEEKGDIL